MADMRRTTARRRGLNGLCAAALVVAGTVAWVPASTAALSCEGYADLVERVSPAVVFIQTEQKAATRGGDEESRPGQRQMPFPPGSPFHDFFERFFDEGQRGSRPPMRGVGSGFVIDEQGHVVTNSHVVANADEITVQLADGREFKAERLGVDEATALAVLKISADKPLPFVGLGDSDQLRVGDVVLAVGNPFGLGGSVTAGIVSARNRNINAGPYDDFIQTDAAINPGNSGGPLFDTDGNVVGVNTAIFSPTGGSVGIGFAVPSNVAQSVAEQLRTKGEVERGWLGVQIQQITPELAQALGLDEAHGALVAQVTPDSPAARAGIRQGEVITAFNGKKLDEMRQLPWMVAHVAPGSEASIELFEGGDSRTVQVTIAELDRQQVAAAGRGGADRQGEETSVLGARLSALDPALRERLELPPATEGVVIADLDPNGRAADQGLRSGDVIQQVGNKKVETPADVRQALEAAKDKSVLLLVLREGTPLYLGFSLA